MEVRWWLFNRSGASGVTGWLVGVHKWVSSDESFIAEAYERFYHPSGIIEIRCTSGQITHIRFHANGTWSVEEDQHHREFRTFGEAEALARQIGGDPDVLPAH